MSDPSTVEIERRFSLDDRLSAVRQVSNAIEYIKATRDERSLLTVVNVVELLNDGLKNAIDGRSCGREHRTLRHRYSNKRDGAKLPIVAEKDRRCERCGAITPECFTRCPSHVKQERP